MKSPAEVVKTACSCFKSSCGANSSVIRSSRFNALRLLCITTPGSLSRRERVAEGRVRAGWRNLSSFEPSPCRSAASLSRRESDYPFGCGLLCSREYRDSVAAIRSYPDLFSDLYGDCAGAKCVTVRMLDDFLHLQRCRIDLHDVRCLHRSGAALS